MKVKELSLLIVNEDQSIRQQLAALVFDRYRSVMAAAPEQISSVMASKSFDLVLTPILEGHAAEEADNSSQLAVSVLRSGITGRKYQFRSLNPEASGCATNPFERVFLEMAIERAGMSVTQVKRIIEHDAFF
jgi:hypothetical protein